MTIAEYMEYEATMKQQYVHPTRNKGVDFCYLSSKSVAKEYLYYSDNVKIDLYYKLPPLFPCFQPVQPRAKFGYESPYVDIVGDMDSIAEYASEEGEREPNKQTESMNDLGASINVMPKSMFKHLELANLKETDMLVEMADMTKKGPIRNSREHPDTMLFMEKGNMECSNNGCAFRIIRDKALMEIACYLQTLLSKSVRNADFNEWVLDSFDIEADYGRTHDDPYSRKFDEYKKESDNEIEQLANEYDLRIGKKGYALDDGFEEEERWESGIEKTNYEPPFVDIQTFEIKWSRFMGMIRKEMAEEGGSHSKEIEFE
ncbi:hypothetical protein Tco_0757459, partial [Tanacetum coccineum]